MLSCNCCAVQYVGESIVPINLRMNIHRAGKSSCKMFNEHYKDVCPGATFSIQILEKLPGNGYKNGKIDTEMRRYRKKREDMWMKLLRTVYPYGLNIKTENMKDDIPVGKLYPPLPRYSERYVDGRRIRGEGNRNLRLSDLDVFLEHLQGVDIILRGNYCRSLLAEYRKADLRKLAADANTRHFGCDYRVKRWYELIIDIFHTKCFVKKDKPQKKAPIFTFPIHFHNKGIDHIKLSSILHDDDVINALPENLKADEPPSIIYTLSGTIRNKIFNYKATALDINTNDLETFGTGIHECECHNSNFRAEHHQHILTGDLRFIQNTRLRKLISKGPNFREPRTINWQKSKEEIKNGLEICGSSLIRSHNGLREEALTPWKDKILEKVDAKIALLKTKIRPHKTNPVLKDPEVIDYLESLHEKYVLVPIDKAANNVAIVCKRYYVQVILKEIGIIGAGNNTYVNAEKSTEEIIDDNICYSKRLGFEVNDMEKVLPTMYWTPKMHKTPVGSRFIIASKLCSTKALSKAVSNVFKLIFCQTENFHTKAKYLSNYNNFWVLQNVDPIINKMNEINSRKRAKSIATYDFSTLYTKIPHNKLVTRLSHVIDFAFEGGDKTCIRLSPKGDAFWGKKLRGKVGFSKSSLKISVKHLIESSYFTVGNLTMRQAIGIPMGIDPAPFWANLFLYTYEKQYMETLIESDKVKARHFHSTKRFIDDLCAINDGDEFGKSYKEIYPEELELKIEHHGQHASFLSLDINIVDGRFVYKLFDKRDAFPFFIVRMPHLQSNIPRNIFYSALVGEFLRVARSTLLVEDFIPKAKDLVKRMNSQGANLFLSQRHLKKIIDNHPSSFHQFNTGTENLLTLIL